MRGFAALQVFLVFLIVSTARNSCRAAFLQKSNTTFGCEDGNLGECLIANDLELEVLMDSYITRILGDTADPPFIDFTNNPTETAVCKNGIAYPPNWGCPVYNPHCVK
ncbi:hypothetical protein P3X46_016344 [Hevea brasiliensis]|uniref:Uncharacterized protein n=1 Tax=Hevea brasiliensis TaxID=3981 RepID=A0ABQ9M2S1_HEVBR|nr:hypothetical protein P3X46_016344 [Hevea brasiliensis]